MSMRLTVKLYGTLSRSFDGYDHLSGLVVTIADEASIDDLLAYLNLASKRLGMVSMNGRLLKKKSPLKDGSLIKIFQPVAGG